MSGNNTKMEPVVELSDNEDIVVLSKSDAEESDADEPLGTPMGTPTQQKGDTSLNPEAEPNVESTAESPDSSNTDDQKSGQESICPNEYGESTEPNNNTAATETAGDPAPGPGSAEPIQRLHEYQIPEWFLAHNVRTSKELNSDATQPPCRIYLTGDSANGVKRSCSTDEASGQGTTETAIEIDSNAKIPGLPEYELPHEVFSALRDLTAAALVPGKDGKLSRSYLGPVIRGLTDDEIPFLSGFLQLIAKNLNASLVTLNWEDLEELGREFDRQDRGIEDTAESAPDGDIDTEPPVNSDEQDEMVDSPSGPPESRAMLSEEPHEGTKSIHDLALHYFSCWPLKNAKRHDWNRVQTTIDTVLDSHIAKSHRGAADSMSPTPNADLGVSLSAENEEANEGGEVDEDPILLVHIEAANRMASIDYSSPNDKYRTLCRFADNIITRRSPDTHPGRGTRVVLIGSIIRHPTEYFYDSDWDRLQAELADYLCVGVSGNVIDLDSHLPSLYFPKEEGESQASTETIEKTTAFIKRTKNLGLLKRALREKIPYLFTEELNQMFEPTVYVGDPWERWLSDHGEAGAEEDGNLGKDYWKQEQVDTIVAQMRGRALGKQFLEMEDVRAVLRRAGMIQQRGSEEAPARDSPAEEDGKEDEENKPETWAERIERIKGEANEVELDLIESVVNPDCINVTFADVVMDPSTKDHLQTLVSLSTTSSSPASFVPLATSPFLKSQLRLSSTLLYGPPGTGKTHLARAIASSFPGSSFLAVDSATLVGKYTGETEKAIKAAFSLARKLSPCVLFMDEVDALFYRRTGEDTSWQRSALAQFLMEMDGINSSANKGQGGQQPFVVVATNRPQDLDEAFYRRLPCKVYFGLPGKEARGQILEGLVGGDLDCDDEGQERITVDELVEKTEGYSGSDLKNLCGEAGLLWAVEMVKKREKEVKTGEEKEAEKKKGEVDAEKKKVVDEIKVKLGASHFTKALTKIRPSVSPVEEPGLKQFLRRFNPGACREVPESHPSQKWVQYHRGAAGQGPM